MDKDETLEMAPSSEHYKKMPIEPIQFIEANNLRFHDGNVVKYVSRWRYKGGVEDLKKAKWYLERLISMYEENKSEK